MLDYENGTTLNLHYGLIHSGLPTQINCRIDKLPFIKSEYMPKHYTLCEEGDVAFADASEDTEEVGKVVEFSKCSENNIVCGLHTIHARDKVQRTVVGYKGYAFSSVPFHHQIRRIAQGTKIYSINTRNFEEVYVGVPGKAEQRKIADFLSLIDDRINTQSKIIEDLQSQKAWICQSYFMQRKAESYGWTKTPLTEVLTERKTYATKGNEYPHATLAKEGIYAKSERYDRDFLVKNEDKSYKITHINDICYNPANLKFGVICRNTFGSAIFSPIYITFEVNSKFNPCFIGYYLTNNDFINRIRKYEEGTIYERMAVSPEDFLRGEIYIPSIEEQNKVVSVIQKLEEKIENELSILGKLKEQKKYLLSNMFI